MNNSEQIRRYALGKQDWKTFKGADPNGTFVSVDWGTNRIMNRLRLKVMKKLKQAIKNYKMVYRLKKHLR